MFSSRKIKKIKKVKSNKLRASKFNCNPPFTPDSGGFDEIHLVRFDPPVRFIQVKSVNEILLDSSYEVDVVESVGPCFFYRLDAEFEAFLNTRKPDFLSR
jgi:hypothetical protein